MWDRVETLENDQNVVNVESLFFNYLAASYELFLNGADEYPEQDEELSINFGMKNFIMDIIEKIYF